MLNIINDIINEGQHFVPFFQGYLPTACGYPIAKQQGHQLCKCDSNYMIIIKHTFIYIFVNELYEMNEYSNEYRTRKMNECRNSC